YGPATSRPLSRTAPAAIPTMRGLNSISPPAVIRYAEASRNAKAITVTPVGRAVWLAVGRKFISGWRLSKYLPITVGLTSSSSLRWLSLAGRRAASSRSGGDTLPRFHSGRPNCRPAPEKLPPAAGACGRTTRCYRPAWNRQLGGERNRRIGRKL